MRAVVLLLALLLSFAAQARADDVTAAQSVIQAQEQAFSRNDAAAAYSHAAPEIKQLFPQADIFLQMVQQAYPPVYRHKSFEFGEARAAQGRIAQRVHIVDDNGEVWEAMYTLEQQPDGSLKITGCSLLKAGQAV
jgi:parvulin-like peptidyl-prolyl isomerase